MMIRRCLFAAALWCLVSLTSATVMKWTNVTQAPPSAEVVLLRALDTVALAWTSTAPVSSNSWFSNFTSARFQEFTGASEKPIHSPPSIDGYGVALEHNSGYFLGTDQTLTNMINGSFCTTAVDVHALQQSSNGTILGWPSYVAMLYPTDKAYSFTLVKAPKVDPDGLRHSSNCTVVFSGMLLFSIARVDINQEGTLLLVSSSSGNDAVLSISDLEQGRNFDDSTICSGDGTVTFLEGTMRAIDTKGTVGYCLNLTKGCHLVSKTGIKLASPDPTIRSASWRREDGSEATLIALLSKGIKPAVMQFVDYETSLQIGGFRSISLPSDEDEPWFRLLKNEAHPDKIFCAIRVGQSFKVIDALSPTSEWQDLPWSGTCDVGASVACATESGVVNSWSTADPFTSQGEFLVNIATQYGDYSFGTLVSAPPSEMDVAVTVWKRGTTQALDPFISVITGAFEICWGRLEESCKAPSGCHWNANIGRCVTASTTWANLTCSEFTNGKTYPGHKATCSDLSSCIVCDAVDVCLSRSSTVFVGGKCPKLCSAIHDASVCAASGECAWRANFCSANVCFSFLKQGFDVMPLLVFILAVVKVSCVLVIWSVFGASFIRFFRTQRRCYSLLPLVAINDAPMARAGTRPAEIVSRDWCFHDYLHIMLTRNFGADDPAPEEVDRVATVLISAGRMMSLRPDGESAIRIRSSEDLHDVVDAVLRARLQPEKSFRFLPLWLKVIPVCYVPSRRAIPRFVTSIDAFPGMLMLSAYVFFAACLIGVSIFEVMQYKDLSVWVQYQLLSFRIMNSSVLVSVAFLTTKYLRGLALRYRYITKSHAMALSHRSEVQRHKLSGRRHALFFVYVLMVAPFTVLSVVGVGRFMWVPLSCIAIAAFCSTIVKRALHGLVNAIGRACARRRSLDDDERSLDSSVSLQGCDTWHVVEQQSDTEELTGTVPTGYGATAPSPDPGRSVNNESVRRYYPAIRSQAFGAAHAFVSFLTVDAVWATALSIAVQLCFNYGLMELNKDAFKLESSMIPATEFASRSTACMLYLIEKEVSDLSVELSHRVQTLSSVLPFF